jgi:glycosyltransferase involved in cell wall biosynthesis
MRIAITHDYLNQFGGAERVLKVLLEMFPQADLYTLLYDKEKTNGIFENNIKGTSFLDVPGVRSRHRAFIPLMPLATYFLKPKKEYDLVISSTAGYGKGIKIKAPYHISYCHSPLRYAWEIDYLKNLPFSPWPLSHYVSHPIAHLLRNWDKRAAQKVNFFIANSNFIASKIKSYYGRDAVTVYPPVDTQTFYLEPETERKDYYLMVGRLLYYKGFDLGIQAFNQLRKPLKIVGRGPELEKLKKIARSPFIEFISDNPSDRELRKIYNEAKALIFPQIEDFGLVAAEAQACGLPVIAFDQGGGREIVQHKKTGILFDEEQSPEAIIKAVKEFENFRFNRKAIAQSAERFSKENFKNNFLKAAGQFGFKDLI